MKKFLAVLCLLSLCACAPTAALPEGAEGGRQVPVEAPPGETAEALGPEIQTIPASPLPTPGSTAPSPSRRRAAGPTPASRCRSSPGRPTGSRPARTCRGRPPACERALPEAGAGPLHPPQAVDKKRARPPERRAAAYPQPVEEKAPRGSGSKQRGPEHTAPGLSACQKREAPHRERGSTVRAKALGRVLPPAGGKRKSISVFFRGHVPRKKHFSARKRARAARALPRAASPLEKMPAFLRGVSKRFDTPRPGAHGSGPLRLSKEGSAPQGAGLSIRSAYRQSPAGGQLSPPAASASACCPARPRYRCSPGGR